MPSMHCSLPLVSFQLGNGVLHCTVEGTHGAAVLSRHGNDRPSMYITRIEPLDGELFCACNFRDPSLVGPSNLKIAGSFDDVRSALPKWVATYKLRRVLFDDPGLYQLFKEPGLTRIMELVPYIKDTQSAFPGVARFEPSVATAPTAAKVIPVVERVTLPKHIIWVIAALVLGYFLLRSCTG
jgi:hypothetical protein